MTEPRPDRAQALEALIVRLGDDAARIVADREAELAELHSQILRLEAELSAVSESRGWRAVLALRRLNGALRGGRGAPPVGSDAGAGRALPALLPELAFAPASQPAVSIVVPVLDQLELTARCLRLVSERTAPGTYELVVVDDGSAEPTSRWLDSIPGLVVARHDRPLGFVAAARSGAGIARGRYICFLNNDTEVGPGWLDSLLEAAESASDVGAVGARMLWPNGRLQEAGSMIWNDATALNRGAGAEAADPQFALRCEVDYCSAAGLLVRRAAYEQVGGFDLRFEPGYYEDADLCLALRAAGYRVLYEPTAVIVHQRGATFRSAIPDRRADRHFAFVRNRYRFAAKWAETLAGQPARPEESR